MKLSQMEKYILSIGISFICGMLAPAAYVTIFATTTTVDVAEVKPSMKEVVQSEFNSENMDDITLVTDNVTGCQYLLGITPRMYSDGIQVCGQSTYPNGEHDEQ